MAAYRSPTYLTPTSAGLARTAPWTGKLDQAIGRTRGIRTRLVLLAFVYSATISLTVFVLLARGFGAAWEYVMSVEHPASFLLVLLLLMVAASLAVGLLDIFLLKPLRALEHVEPDATLGQTIARFFKRHEVLEDRFANLATEVGTLSEERKALSAQVASLAARENWASATVRAITALTRDSVFVTGSEGCIRDLSPAAQELIGMSRDEAEGRRFSEIVRLYDLEESDPLEHPLSRLVEDVLEQGATTPVLTQALLEDGRGARRPVFAHTVAVPGHDGSMVAAVVRLHAASDDQAEEQTATETASARPPPEADSFEHRVGDLVESAREQNRENALLFLSVDSLDAVTDRFGRAAGDALLWEVEQIVRGQVLAPAETFRVSSTHFGVLLPESGADDAKSVAERLRVAVDGREFKWREKRYDATISVAVVPVTAECEGPHALLDLADDSLIAAKLAGGNRVHVYDADPTVSRRRHADQEWSSWLTRHLNQGRVHLISQEVQSLRPDLEPMLEMLVRVEAEDGGWESPGLFLPSLVRRDLMPKLDLQLIKRVVMSLEHSPGSVDGYSTLCINLSGSSITQPRFAELVLYVLTNSSAPANRLAFEVAALDAINYPAEFARFVQFVHPTGARFGLDRCKAAMDLNLLSSLPIDYVKIHPSLIEKAVHDPLDRAYVEWIQRAVQLLGRRTVATGVENEETLSFARSVGVDFVQGVHVNRLGPLII